jgi:hypothetical protein
VLALHRQQADVESLLLGGSTPLDLASPALLPELLSPGLDVPHPVNPLLLLPGLLEDLKELEVLDLPVPVPVEELEQLEGLLPGDLDPYLFEELVELRQGDGLRAVGVELFKDLLQPSLMVFLGNLFHLYYKAQLPVELWSKYLLLFNDALADDAVEKFLELGAADRPAQVVVAQLENVVHCRR